MRHLSTLLSLLFVAALSAQVPQLWGLTASGGAHDLGTIFRMDGNGYADVFDFDTLSGGGPEGGLCVANGKLYGMTTLHGAHLVGTLFSYDPTGEGFHKIMDFDMTNGGLPWGSMIKGSDGMLYGTTYQGGGTGGSIFRLDPADDAYEILHVLTQATDGGGVTDRLLEGPDGALYGTAAYGGADNKGTIFRYDVSTDTYTKLHDFDDVDGSTPYGALCDGGDGLLYGMAFEGGSDDKGVLYSIDPSNGTFTKRLDFTGPNGQAPWGSLVRAADGTLYGSTTLGGPGSGSLFSFVPATNTLTTRYSFNAVDGGLLFGAVIMGSDGNLYGTSNVGGTTFQGNIFRFNTIAGTLSTLHSFNGTDGLTPRSELVELGTTTGIADRDAGPRFTCFPSPTTGDVTVVTDGRPATLRISNAMGRLVRTEQLSTGSTHLHLDVAPGLYHLTLTTREGRTTRTLVVH